MPRILHFLMILSLLASLAGCDKDNNDSREESVFYGTWVKGNHQGDTLYFFRSRGINIMRSNQSFNPGLNAITDREFKYEDGIIHLKTGDHWWPIESFSWKIQGREFEVEGIQVYMFMSAMGTKFTFHKLP